MHLAIGHSDQPDPFEALQSIFGQVQNALQRREPKAGLLFSGYEQDHDYCLQEIGARFPNLPIIGCTSYGEFSSAISYQEDSTAFGLLCGQGFEVGAGQGFGLQNDLQGTVKRAIDQALSQIKGPLQMGLAFVDGLSVSSQLVLEEIQKQLGPDIPIFGGSAADDWNFEKTILFFNERRSSDGLVLLLFSGNFQYSFGLASGWSAISQKVRITGAKGNQVFTIDHQPAKEFYKYYLGDHKRPSGEFPLIIHTASGDSYLRACIGYNEANGSITFSGDVPEGAYAQLTDATKEAILDAAQLSARQARERFQGKPHFALCFSCAARRQVLGIRTHMEFEIISKEIGSKVPVLGFYTYGEFCPLQPQKPSLFQNESFVTLLIGP
ncbi:MAG: FIST C-terminal domain-containing protein [Acidobacteria bacterium]|nr:FIST C-terminal domain-containing protein [Acidobacteriota bacterium]MCB9397084.1 FIST C-terminal domain-containing protein [Acidobacteriota bacterium]